MKKQTTFLIAFLFCLFLTGQTDQFTSSLYDTYDTPTHDLFIGEIVETYADESVLTEGKVDLAKLKPLLFDMSSIKYWSVGEVVADCWKLS